MYDVINSITIYNTCTIIWFIVFLFSRQNAICEVYANAVLGAESDHMLKQILQWYVFSTLVVYSCHDLFMQDSWTVIGVFSGIASRFDLNILKWTANFFLYFSFAMQGVYRSLASIIFITYVYIVVAIIHKLSFNFLKFLCKIAQ